MKKVLTLVAGLMMLSASAETVTLYDGTATSQDIPVCSRFMDWAEYYHQSIYPEAQLTAMNGQAIKSVKYYVANENGSTLNGGNVSLYIGTTDQNNFGGYSVSLLPTDNLTKVAGMAMPLGANEIEFVFDEPWTYEGGNIVIYTVIDADGSVVGSEATNFLGEAVEAASACGNWSVTAKDFIPKTTFTYGEGGDEPQVLRGDANDDGEVNISDVTAIVDNLLNSTPINMTNADCNNEEGVNIGDVTALIDFLMVGVWN